MGCAALWGLRLSLLLKQGFHYKAAVKHERVYRGQKQYVDVVPERDTVQLTLPKDAHGQLEYRLEVEPDLRAPVADDTVIGSIEVQWEIEEGQVMTIDQWPLYPGETVERGGWWRQIWDTLLLLIQDLRAAILGMLD